MEVNMENQEPTMISYDAIIPIDPDLGRLTIEVIENTEGHAVFSGFSPQDKGFIQRYQLIRQMGDRIVSVDGVRVVSWSYARIKRMLNNVVNQKYVWLGFLSVPPASKFSDGSSFRTFPLRPIRGMECASMMYQSRIGRLNQELEASQSRISKLSRELEALEKAKERLAKKVTKMKGVLDAREQLTARGRAVQASSHGIGTTVLKYFPGHGFFRGKIRAVEEDRYVVVYEDGDDEEFLFGADDQEIDTVVAFADYMEQMRS
jgi:hypothetical protein